ncbi:diguanylate cyclase domain-containing protein [Kineococcus sp. SYSU DK018]|uniref:diguanylate cyclase domain-containing protein n=1 Tax=Kineococcus sp. SYSU DK018 TaxID=3383139 RepID=UPI003D7CEEDF
MGTRGARVALVVDRVEDYALPVVRGMESVLAPAGASLLVLVHPRPAAQARSWVERLRRAGSIDALVVSTVADPATGTSAVAGLVAQAGGLPVVTLGGDVPGVPDVSCDNAAGTALAVDHLLAGGRRHPLLVAGPADSADSLEREAAFAAAVARAGLPPAPVVRADFHRETAYRRTVQVLGSRGAVDAVDAVFAANDEMALGVLDALAAGGRRVPEDVVVAGFDDTSAAATAEVPLTSVDPHLAEQGELAARLVLDLLRGGGVPARVRTGCELVVRASTAGPEGAGPPGTGAVVPVELLRDVRSGLLVTHHLLGLKHGLSSVVSEDDLARELTAYLPRVAVRRAHLATVRDGRARLVYSTGTPPAGAPTGSYPVEELLPGARRGELAHGTLVVQVLAPGGHERGLLLHEQDRLDRYTAEALHQDLTAALQALQRARRARAHAAELERLVAERTAQLQAEVHSRRLAQEELTRANARLSEALLVDGLTGVRNRPAFDDALRRAWREHERTGQPLSVLLCDVDRFKAYNDTAGHLAGDACLRAVAACIADAVRRSDDVVARFGGEEFAVVLPAADAAAAERVAARVLRRVRAAALPHPGCGPGATVSVSVGVATSATAAGAGPEDLLRTADGALYRAKDTGRDRLVLAGALP